MSEPSQDTWIMVAGPYSCSGKASKEEKQCNLKVLVQTALELFNRGYIPVIGVVNALPLIELDERLGNNEAYEQIMMPYSLALAERCDVCLRIGGASKGADEEVARFRAANKDVYNDISEVPHLKPHPSRTPAHKP